MKKGQISMEYMATVAVLIFILIPFAYYALSEFNDAVKINKINNAVQDIANSVNAAYALGPGTKVYVIVNLPLGVSSLSILGNREVKLNYMIHGTTSEASATALPNMQISGTLSVNSGMRKYEVEVLGSGCTVGTVCVQLSNS